MNISTICHSYTQNIIRKDGHLLVRQNYEQEVPGSYISLWHVSGPNAEGQQECIPVGCVPAAR